MNKKDIEAHAFIFARKVESWVVKNIFSDFTLAIKLDWSPSRKSCRGGMYRHGPGINMAMHICWPDTSLGPYRFYEYRSYDANSEIGGFYSDCSEHKLEALLLHEIAHAIQFFDYQKNCFRCAPHGPVFKKYYKQLRKSFLNYKLPNQTQMKKQYEHTVEDLLYPSRVRAKAV